jgi:HK97 family phage portal protein
MRNPFGFIRRFKEKLYRDIRAKVLEEVAHSYPDPQSYLQDYQATDSKIGRDLHVSYVQLEILYKKESWVRSAVDAIVRGATSQGFKLIADEGTNLNNVDKKKLAQLRTIFEQPNDEDTFTDLVEEIIIDLHIYGDAYLEVVYGKDGLPAALYNVYCPSMRVLVNEHGVVKGYVQLKGGWGSTEYVTFKKENIIHIRMPNPGNEVYGLSPLESLAMPIETDLYAQAYNRDFFKNDATPRLHVDMGNCTIDQLNRNRLYWRTQFRGTGNPHKTIVTEGGAKVTPVGTPPKDMEFLNQRKFSRDEILGVFGVPPGKVGIYEDANRANAKEQDRTFKAEKIIPLQNKLEEKINRAIVTKFELPYKFKFVEIDLEDESEQSEIDERDLRGGVVTINEVRRRRGLKDVEWGNTPILRENVAPIETENKEE